MPRLLYDGPFKKAVDVAGHYGFSLTRPPVPGKDDISRARSLQELHERKSSFAVVEPSFVPEERNALLRFYSQSRYEKRGQPLLLCHSRHSLDKKVLSQFRLDIFGARCSAAEALLIKTSLEILDEFGGGDFWVELNSVGDRENYARFAREVTLFYRKHLSDLPAACRQNFVRSPLRPLECENHDVCRAIREDAPKSVSFLSEKSRRHFEEVLEFLESMGVPYRLNNSLLGHKNYSSEVVFQIKSKDSENEKVMVKGERFDGLARRLGYKRDVCGASAVLGIADLWRSEKYKEVEPGKVQEPKVYLVQLGFEARVRGISVLSLLRKSNMPVVHSMGDDRLLSQLAAADELGVPYVIILGQREAVDNSVIIRNRETRFQETVGMNDLLRYLKRLK